MPTRTLVSILFALLTTCLVSAPALACQDIHVEHYGEVEPKHTRWQSIITCNDPFSNAPILFRFAQPIEETDWVSTSHRISPISRHDGKLDGFSTPWIPGEPLIIETQSKDITPPLLQVDVIQPIALRGVNFDIGELTKNTNWIKQMRDVRQRDITREERDRSREAHPDLVSWDHVVVIHARANDIYAQAGGITSIVTRPDDASAHPGKLASMWLLLLLLPAFYMIWRKARATSQREEVEHFLNAHTGDL